MISNKEIKDLVEEIHNRIKREFPNGCKGLECEDCILIISDNAPKEFQSSVNGVCNMLLGLSKLEE